MPGEQAAHGANARAVGEILYLSNTPFRAELPSVCGLQTEGDRKGEKKPANEKTKFMTSSFPLACELERERDGRHEHQWLTGVRAKNAAMYRTGMCPAICRILMKELQNNVKSLRCLLRIKAEDK